MNISISVSAIRAHTDWMNANATNVANVNSRENSSLETTINENTAKSVEANIVSQGVPVEIAEEITEQVPILYGIEANVVAVKTADETTKNLLDVLV